MQVIANKVLYAICLAITSMSTVRQSSTGGTMQAK